MRRCGCFYRWRCFKRNNMTDYWYKYRTLWAALAFGCALFFIFIGWGIWAYVGFLLFSAIDIWQNRKILFSNITRILSMGAITGIGFGVGKIMALKYFNMQYGILPEYLNYSVTVFAWLFALTVLLGFLLLLGVMGFMLGMSCCAVWQFAKDGLRLVLLKPPQSTSSKNDLPRFIHMLSAIILGFLLLHSTSQMAVIDKWALWLDAYQNTDCGDGFFLRQDKRHCYRFITVQAFPWVDVELLPAQTDD